MDDIFVGIVSLENTDDAFLARDRINKYLGIPKDKINIFQNKPIKSDNYLNKAHNLTANHLKIINKAYHENFKYVLIFEDDVDFVNFKYRNIKDVFYKSIDDLKELEKIDLLNFGSTLTPMLKLKNNIFLVDHTNHAHMYILSRNGMRKLLDLFYPKKFEQDYLGLDNVVTLSQLDIRYFSFLTNAIVSPSISYQRKMPNIFKKINLKENHHKILDLNLFIYQEYVYYLSIFILFIGLFNKKVSLLFFILVLLYQLGIIVSKIFYGLLNYFQIY